MTKETKQEEPKKTETTVKNSPSEKDIEENKVITFLSYLGILSLVPLLAKQDSKFAQFHAKQGIVLFVACFAIAWIAGFIPFIGWFLIVPAISILTLVLSIMGLINVAKGETKELPIIGELVKKFKI